MVGDYVAGAIGAIDKQGLSSSTSLYMSCVDKASAQLILEGKIKKGNDGIGLSSALAPTLLLNWLDGHPILDANGKAPRLQTIPFEVNQGNADEYIAVFYGDKAHPITEKILKELCFRYNDKVTYQSYIDLINNGLNLLALMDANGVKAN
jgi:hypothetical protein